MEKILTILRILKILRTIAYLPAKSSSEAFSAITGQK